MQSSVAINFDDQKKGVKLRFKFRDAHFYVQHRTNEFPNTGVQQEDLMYRLLSPEASTKREKFCLE